MLFAGGVAYLDYSALLAPQLIQEREIQTFLKDSFNTVNGNILGDENANIVVEEYIDYNCGGCYLQNVSSHRVVTELSGVRINQNMLPLDQSCNKYMPNPGHKNSCLKARYRSEERRVGKECRSR